MTQPDEQHAPATPDHRWSGGSQIGKRYEAGAVEVLCISAGAGTLSIGATVMELKAAKPLPSSD